MEKKNNPETKKQIWSNTEAKTPILHIQSNIYTDTDTPKKKLTESKSYIKERTSN